MYSTLPGAMIVSENIGVSINNFLEIYMSLDTFIREVKSFPMKEPFKLTAEYTGDNSVTIKLYLSKNNNKKNFVSYETCVAFNPVLYLESGRTQEGYRRKGYGTWIRAVATWCAKRAGFKQVRQASSFLTNTPKTQRPTSAYIMNKLGFKFNKPNFEGETTEIGRAHV